MVSLGAVPLDESWLLSQRQMQQAVSVRVRCVCVCARACLCLCVSVRQRVETIKYACTHFPLLRRRESEGITVLGRVRENQHNAL